MLVMMRNTIQSRSERKGTPTLAIKNAKLKDELNLPERKMGLCRKQIVRSTCKRSSRKVVYRFLTKLAYSKWRLLIRTLGLYGKLACGAVHKVRHAIFDQF